MAGFDQENGDFAGQLMSEGTSSPAPCCKASLQSISPVRECLLFGDSGSSPDNVWGDLVRRPSSTLSGPSRCRCSSPTVDALRLRADHGRLATPPSVNPERLSADMFKIPISRPLSSSTDLRYPQRPYGRAIRADCGVHLQ